MGKLVRDNIPQIIKNNGQLPITKVLNEDEYWQALLTKDTEELLEVKNANSTLEIKEELADKLELIIAMANYNGFSLQDIIDESNKKREKNGGFEKRIFLEKVIKKWYKKNLYLFLSYFY